MNKLWFNIRFGKRHLQIGPDTLSFNVNPYWDKVSNPKRWFVIYCWFGKYYD